MAVLAEIVRTTGSMRHPDTGLTRFREAVLGSLGGLTGVCIAFGTYQVEREAI